MCAFRLAALVVLCLWWPGQGLRGQTSGESPAKGSGTVVKKSGLDALEHEVGAFEVAFTNQVRAMASEPPPVTSARFSRRDLLLVLLVLAGGFLLRKLFPERTGSVEPTWSSAIASQNEEQAFADFAASFRVGPETPSSRSERGDGRATENGPKKTTGPDTPARPASLREFLGGTSKQQLLAARKLIADLAQSPDEAARQRVLGELCSQVRLLKDEAGLPELFPIWQMSAALEGLLKQLMDKPVNITPSTLRTVAGGIDVLEALFIPNLRPDLATEPPIRLLAVDDDPICRHAVSFALKKALTAPDLVVDGPSALALAAQHPYDAIFLDIEMPGMDGFELCAKVREAGPNRTTPVAFITSYSDFQSRAKSVLIGGQDLIGKPFLTFEVTVKALTLVLRGRLQGKDGGLQPSARCATEASSAVTAMIG